MGIQKMMDKVGIRMAKTTLLVMLFAGLGGILYGYDLGIIADALLFMKPDLALDPQQSSWLVSAVLWGTAVATLFAGPFADRYGRRFSLVLSAIVFIIGVVIVVLSGSFVPVLAGRLIQGIGTGIITVVVPLYLVEMIPPKLRGRGVTTFQLCLTFGILLGYLVGYALHGSGDWHAMFATMLIPAVAFLAGGVLFLPRSPRWLYRRGFIDEARESLARLQEESEVDQAIEEIAKAIEEEKKQSNSFTHSQEKQQNVNNGLLKRGFSRMGKALFKVKQEWGLLLRPGFRKAFLIALAIGILNQLTGINSLLQFNTIILHQSGLHSSGVAILGSVGVGLANFLITIIALSLVDKVGRRPLLIIGTAGVLISLLFIGVVHLVLPASTFVGYATLVGFIVFIIFYAVGPGVVVWLAISEVLPLAIRAKGMAVALFANSVISAGLATVFMGIVQYIGYSGIFFLLAFFVFLYLLTAIFPLPETKDKSLEEIEREFLGRVKSKSLQADN